MKKARKAQPFRSSLALRIAILQNKGSYSAQLARSWAWGDSRRSLTSKSVHTCSHLLRDSIPSIRMVAPPVLHNPQVILTQLPDVSVKDRPTSSYVPIKLLRFKLHVVEVVAHLVQSVRQALAFHESQGAGRDSTHSAEDSNAGVRVDARQTAEDDEDGAEHELQHEQGVGEDVEDAVLCVDVLVLCDDPGVHAVLHAQPLWVL